jgi:hypothetical protein
LDCNQDDRNDQCEIQESPSLDENENGFLDECETLAAFVDCMSGPGVLTSPQNPLHDVAFCLAAFDYDENAQVDMLDCAVFLVIHGP